MKGGVNKNLNAAPLLHRSIIIFCLIVEQIYTFVPSKQKFKTFVMVEVGLLHSQIFINSHLYLLVIAKSATSQVFLSCIFYWKQTIHKVNSLSP
jgi:hypothetical protein